jgi:hypothetical protein
MRAARSSAALGKQSPPVSSSTRRTGLPAYFAQAALVPNRKTDLREEPDRTAAQ